MPPGVEGYGCVRKKNDCVTEGMVLAVVEKEDISLTLKQKELEILKLENSINELSASYENGVSEQERLIELAKREMDDAKEELESLEQLFNAGLRQKTMWTGQKEDTRMQNMIMRTKRTNLSEAGELKVTQTSTVEHGSQTATFSVKLIKNDLCTLDKMPKVKLTYGNFILTTMQWALVIQN